MSESDSGFSVKDRRAFNPDGSPRDDSAPEAPSNAAPDKEVFSQEANPRETKPSDAPHKEAPQGSQGPSQAQRVGRGKLPPVDFSGFVMSLAHAAVLHLGQAPDPRTGQAQPDLEMARHTIDTLAMIKDKTAGNLTDEEQKLIDSVVSELRLIYVQVSQPAR